MSSIGSKGYRYLREHDLSIKKQIDDWEIIERPNALFIELDHVFSNFCLLFFKFIQEIAYYLYYLINLYLFKVLKAIHIVIFI